MLLSCNVFLVFQWELGSGVHGPQRRIEKRCPFSGVKNVFLFAHSLLCWTYLLIKSKYQEIGAPRQQFLCWSMLNIRVKCGLCEADLCSVADFLQFFCDRANSCRINYATLTCPPSWTDTYPWLRRVRGVRSCPRTRRLPVQGLRLLWLRQVCVSEQSTTTVLFRLIL